MSTLEKDTILKIDEICSAIALMGKEMNAAQCDRTLSEIKANVGSNELEQIELAALIADSPIYSDLRMYRAEMGFNSTLNQQEIFEIARSSTGLLDGRSPISNVQIAREYASALAQKHGEAFQLWNEKSMMDVISPNID